jgi:transcriptional regulator with XRE-family HTH domain
MIHLNYIGYIKENWRLAMNDARRIGAQIKRFRELGGLSKSELARRLRVSPTAVNNWEENGVMPRLDILIAMERVLEVNLIQLMTSSDGNGASPSEPSVGEAPRHEQLEQFRRRIAALFEVSPEKIEILIRT